VRVFLAVVIVAKLEHVAVDNPSDENSNHNGHVNDNVLHDALWIVKHAENRESQRLLHDQENKQNLTPQNDRDTASSVRSSPNFGHNYNNTEKNKRNAKSASDLFRSEVLHQSLWRFSVSCRPPCFMFFIKLSLSIDSSLGLSVFFRLSA